MKMDHQNEKYLALVKKFFLCFQSFKDVWDMACSSPSRSKIVIPAGYSFLVRSINFAGPCRSKVSLRVSA